MIYRYGIPKRCECGNWIIKNFKTVDECNKFAETKTYCKCGKEMETIKE